MASRLVDKRTIVTGASHGIGAEIARTFAREGAAVAVLDIDGDAGHDIATEVGGFAIAVDLADPAATVDAVTAAIDALGGVDVLVNNAGILRMAPLLEITVEEWDLTFDVNVRSMLLTIQVAAKAMIAAGEGGAILNLASMGGKIGSPNQAHYAASKAAVMGLTRVAAMELGCHRIRVNSICPDYVLTEMGADTRSPELVRSWEAMSPIGRLGCASDVALMALFLASDEASYCTGQAMNVSGGMVMH